MASNGTDGVKYDPKTEDPYYLVYKELRGNGACKICSFRFLCNAEQSTSLDKLLISKGYEKANDENAKQKKSNSCVICLGLFEQRTMEDAGKQVLNEISKSGYDCETYMLALIVPVSCNIRERSTYAFLKSKFPNLYENCPYAPRLGLKESWRFYSCPSISELIKKRLDIKSELVIQITFSYAGDCKDYYNIAKIVKQHAVKGKMNITNSLKLLDDVEFLKLYPFPMDVPDDVIRLSSITVKRDSIFFAGRYNKFSRELSQTPWFLADGERKMELSVEEIISNKLKDLMKAEDSKFSSSGREDVDVRTLGTGRPFAVELLNPRISDVPFDIIRETENEINKIGEKLVFVRDLQIVLRNELLKLKNGEEQKTKAYCCLCIIKKKCDIDELRKKLPEVPFVIQQKTPIRVLHRRTVATRPKIIHTLNIESVDTPPPEGCTIFKLNLKTEAGTYIKEFVHGDFGRTQPNISSIFDDQLVDVLALDVTNVEVNWPPAINYENRK